MREDAKASFFPKDGEARVERGQGETRDDGVFGSACIRLSFQMCIALSSGGIYRVRKKVELG